MGLQLRRRFSSSDLVQTLANCPKTQSTNIYDRCKAL